MNQHYERMLYQTLSQLADIPSEEWEGFLNIFSEIHLKKNEHFIKVGEKPKRIGFILSGVVRFYYITEEGTEFNKSFCAENDFVASYSGLLQDKESRYSIQALEDTTLLVANYEDYKQLLEHHICWNIVSRRLAETLFIKKEKRESEFLLDDAETRYLQFLKEYPSLEKRIKNYHIASYLGITPVAMSRIRAKLDLTD